MPYRILVVDDEESPNTLILSALEQSDNEFKNVKSFKTAVSILQTFVPHAIVAVFGDTDAGISESIKGFRVHTSVPIIIACSSDVCTRAERALGNEVEEFIELPCSPDRALRVLHTNLLGS